MKTQHTPTPWQFDNDDILGPDGRLIAAMADDDGVPFRNEIANAAFIVRAVNTHGKLLAACKALLDIANFNDLSNTDAKWISDAIAKAEGK